MIDPSDLVSKCLMTVDQNSGLGCISDKEFDRLYETGLRFLSLREHSVKELSLKLMRKSERTDLVLAVIAALENKKFLSDERFTESFVRSRACKGFGPIRIRLELRDKGIQSNLVETHIDQNADLWVEVAYLQYAKKFGSSKILDYGEWAKRARFMQSRGFNSEQIDRVIGSYCDH